MHSGIGTEEMRPVMGSIEAQAAVMDPCATSFSRKSLSRRRLGARCSLIHALFYTSRQ